MKLLKQSEFWLGVVILVNLVINFVWLMIDKNPPAWDQAAHMRSVVLVNQFLSGTFWGSFVDLIKSFGGYPPLIYFLGGFWTLFFGVTVTAISTLNSVFLVLAMIGVYLLGGLWPVIIFSLFPVIYDISRNFLLDLPLTVFVIWGLYFWIKKNDSGWLLMLVFASLTKLNGFIYFGPMVLISIFENYKDKEFWMKLTIAGAGYLLLVGWWWGINFQNIFQYLTGLAGQGESLTDPMNLADWVTWIHYFRLFFLHQAGPILAIACVVSWFKIEKNKKNGNLIWWTVLIYAIFTIIKNKDFRFTMPILPVLAVWLGEKIYPFWLSPEHPPLTRKVRQVVLCVFFGFLSFNLLENSFGWPIKKPVILTTPTYLLGDINWVNFADYPVRAASVVKWPNEELVKDMISIYADRGSKVLVLTDSAEINDNNLKLYRDMATNKMDQALEMHSIYEPNFNGWENFDAVLVTDKQTEPAPFYATNLEYLKVARDFVWDNSEKFSIIKEYLLPNGQKLWLMEIKKIPQMGD